jgi:hypothetical protein
LQVKEVKEAIVTEGTDGFLGPNTQSIPDRLARLEVMCGIQLVDTPPSFLDRIKAVEEAVSGPVCGGGPALLDRIAAAETALQ